jgi:hypothetical protein
LNLLAAMYFLRRAGMGTFYFPSRGVSNTLHLNILWEFFGIGIMAKGTNELDFSAPLFIQGSLPPKLLGREPEHFSCSARSFRVKTMGGRWTCPEMPAARFTGRKCRT